MGRIAFVVMVLMMFACACSANLQPNGSFEQWEPTLPEYEVTPSTQTVSYYDPLPYETDYSWLPGWVSNYYGYDYCTSNLWMPSDGDRFIRLRENYTGDGMYNGAWTTPGKEYLLEFDMAGDCYNGPNVKSTRFQLWSPNWGGINNYYDWDGTGKVGVLNFGDDPGWEKHSVWFKAQDTSALYAFTNNTFGDNIWGGALIDNVTVEETPNTLLYFDATYAWFLPYDYQCYEHLHAAAAIQGLANRYGPKLFVKHVPTYDDNWWWRLQESGGFCEGWGVRTIPDWVQLVNTFRPYIKGLVLYDPFPITTPNSNTSISLVATTAAACEDAIPVRKDASFGSLYNYLTGTMGLPVLIDLTGKFPVGGYSGGKIWQTNTNTTGSTKCDAYIWAKEKYLDTGKCDPTVVSYTLDLYGLGNAVGYCTQLCNLDYAVSKKAFCFELDPWPDEYPIDDPNQPLGTDFNTFKTILGACNARNNYGKMIKFCGGPNWMYKYSNFPGAGGIHENWHTEWQLVKLATAYNAYVEYDVHQSNTSLYSALAPTMASRRYVQNPPPTYTGLQSSGIIDVNGNIVPGNYILLGMGDYDGPAITEYEMPVDYWNDSNRGVVNCSWGLDPNLTDRLSVMIDWLYRHKSSKDYFMAWASGAGYINPTGLYGTRYQSGYGSAVSMWQAHCRKHYRPLDYSISGWLLPGSSPPVSTTDYANYAPFSGDGIGAQQTIYTVGDSRLVNNVPCNTITGDLGDSSNPNYTVIDYASGVNFGWYRTTNWTPTNIKTLQDGYATSGHNHRFLDAFTYYYLLRYYLSGNQQSSNYYRCTWVSDTIPKMMMANQMYSVTVTVRNDGWDTWSDPYRLGYGIVSSGSAPSYPNRAYMYNPSQVSPGQSEVFSFDITAPSTPGNYDIYYDMVRDGVTWFHDQNNIEWMMSVVVQ